MSVHLTDARQLQEEEAGGVRDVRVARVGGEEVHEPRVQVRLAGGEATAEEEAAAAGRLAGGGGGRAKEKAQRFSTPL